MAVFEKGDWSVRRWYRYQPHPFSPPKSDGEAMEELLDIYKRAAKRHLISDVPVGLLLSGGVDSGLLLGLMSLYGKAWPTYTVGYGRAEYRDDELADAAETARIFSAPNMPVQLSREAFEESLPNIVSVIEEPIAASFIAAISLEILDLIFRGYTALKSWDVLRSVIYGKDFNSIFIMQYGIGNHVPLILFLIPGLTIRRAILGVLLVPFGVFMMRWNVVIGGQAFSLSYAGYMHYHLPIIPHNWETFKEGLGGALSIFIMPFALFWAITGIFPVFAEAKAK